MKLKGKREIYGHVNYLFKNNIFSSFSEGGKEVLETFSIRFFIENRKMSRDHGLAAAFVCSSPQGIAGRASSGK